VRMLGVVVFCLNILSNGGSPLEDPMVCKIIDPRDGPKPMRPVPGVSACWSTLLTLTLGSKPFFNTM
jgi:hypothetical protein